MISRKNPQILEQKINFYIGIDSITKHIIAAQ